MTDDAPDIPPALSESEWAQRYRHRLDVQVGLVDDTDGTTVLVALPGSVHVPRIPRTGSVTIAMPDAIRMRDVNDLAALIALANEMLRRFDDPRAVTRELVGDLRSAIGNVEMIAGQIEPNDAGVAELVRARAARLEEFADALESYLPPNNG